MHTIQVSAQSHHLPQQFTSFVGREQEMADIRTRLADPACRLLTLVGPGGIGKTRLAIQATAVSTNYFPDGTYFVNLQAVTKPDFFIVTIADALGLSLSGQEVPLRQLHRFLANKQLLLTLDNFEQLLTSTDLILDLLHQTAVTILITSREPLNLQEEWLFPVHGLPLSDTQSAAMQLFSDRAQRVQPHFNLIHEKDNVAAICRLVEGMPLALELAAAWTRSLPCTEIVTEIQANLDILSTSVRNVPERHRSIQTIFEQTWQQLNEAEQTIFRRLSVFRGGFQREAAAAVADASLLTLSDLIDKSLLRWELDNKGNGRYQILELLRQYSAEKLAQNEHESVATKQKHTDYYTTFLSGRLDGLLGNQQHLPMSEIQADLENIRFVWQQLINALDYSRLEQASMPLLSFYWHRSRFLEGQKTFSKLTGALYEAPQTLERDAVLAISLNGLAQFMMMLGELEESTRLAEASLALYETHRLPMPAGMDTDPRLTLANNARLLGDNEAAVSYAQAALKYNQQHNHLRNAQEAYRMIAEAQIGLQALDEAWYHAERSFALAEEVNELSRLAYTHETLGAIAFAQGQDEAAEHHYQESYQLWAQLGHEIGRADMLQRLGDLACRRQAYAEAEDYFTQCLPLFEERHVSGGILSTLVRLGQTAVSQQQCEAARHHFLQAIPIALTFPHQFGELTTQLILGVAQLFLEHDAVDQATLLLAYLHDNPNLAADEKIQVQTMRQTCQLHMEKEGYETAVSLGQTTPLETHLTNLQTSLSTPLPEQTTDTTPSTSIKQPLIDRLTPRELEVLQLIANGLSNQEIADDLFISKGTVKYYSSHIYSKLQVSNRSHAVATARELGILQE